MQTSHTSCESKTPAVNLRRRAEEIARKKTFQIPEHMESLSIEAARQMLHELRVHQIELEMQNEELRRAEGELEASRVRYFDLYDLAPVGYCTLSDQGLILEVNLTAATLLGVARSALVKQPITRFIFKQDQDLYYQHLRKLLESGQPQACELRMVKMDGAPIWVGLEATVAQDADGMPVCRAVLSNITKRKQAVEALLTKTMLLEAQSETSIDGILAVDNEGRSILFNKRFGELWKISQDILDTKHDAMMLECILNQLKDPEEFGSRVAYLYEHRAEKSRDEVEFADGRYFDRYSSPLLSTDGQHLGRIWFFRDISKRKRVEKELRRALDSLRRAVGVTIQVMVSAVEVRDPYTAGHQLRVADLVSAIAAEIGFTQDKIVGIHMAGSIHDIGKLSIPAEILSKPTKLSELEFSLIKEHSQRGYEILKNVESPWPLAEIVYQHHERMDGSGYPRNLKGDDILIEARILAVADVVESMASHRPYRAGLGIEAALEEIEKNRGTFYDEAVADACLRLFREKGFQLAET